MSASCLSKQYTVSIVAQHGSVSAPVPHCANNHFAKIFSESCGRNAKEREREEEALASLLSKGREYRICLEMAVTTARFGLQKGKNSKGGKKGKGTGNRQSASSPLQQRTGRSNRSGPAGKPLNGPDRQVWFPGLNPPAHLDGSLPGDAGCASPFLVVVSQHEFFSLPTNSVVIHIAASNSSL
jgi:hypothetical protein